MCICYIQNTATEWHVRSVCRTGNECDESNIAEGHELGLRYSDASSDDRKKVVKGRNWRMCCLQCSQAHILRHFVRDFSTSGVP